MNRVSIGKKIHLSDKRRGKIFLTLCGLSRFGNLANAEFANCISCCHIRSRQLQKRNAPGEVKA